MLGKGCLKCNGSISPTPKTARFTKCTIVQLHLKSLLSHHFCFSRKMRRDEAKQRWRHSILVQTLKTLSVWVWKHVCDLCEQNFLWVSISFPHTISLLECYSVIYRKPELIKIGGRMRSSLQKKKRMIQVDKILNFMGKRICSWVFVNQLILGNLTYQSALKFVFIIHILIKAGSRRPQG